MIKHFIRRTRWNLFVGKNFSFLSPMTWTWLSLFLAIIALVLVGLQYIYSGLIVFIFSGLLDGVDGNVARYSNRVTYLGGFTDGVVDRFVDFLMILCFFFLDFPDWGMDINILLFLLLFATLLPPFIVAYANHRQTVPDPTERVIWRFAFRPEYIILFMAGLFFYPIQADLALSLLYLALILNWATVIQAMILVFIKAKNYNQKNEQASLDFHQRLREESKSSVNTVAK